MVGSVEFVKIQMDESMIASAEDVLLSKRYVKGPILDTFEQDFAEFCGTEHAVGVSNGTAAILLSLKALDIEVGCEVIVPAHTFFATVSPVLEQGAQPVVVDVDSRYYTLDPDGLVPAIEAADSPRAIIATHMHGQPALIQEIRDIAEEYGLLLIEDAAQAHGATVGDRRVGSFGDVGCFSFYPTKNMTVGGDGGMIVTDDSEVAGRVRKLRNHGRDSEGIHRQVGLNYRLNEINAAIGIEQLDRLPEWNRQRREAAEQYSRRLRAIDQIDIPSEREGAKHVYHHYPIKVPDRQSFCDALAQRNIETQVHYETPAHRHPAVRDHIVAEDCPTAERLCNEIVSLPMHPQLSPTEIEYVTTEIHNYYA